MLEEVDAFQHARRWQRQDVGEEAECSGNARGQLSKEGIADVEKAAPAILAGDESALVGFLARVGTGEEGMVSFVPLTEKVEAAVTNPAVKIM